MSGTPTIAAQAAAAATSLQSLFASFADVAGQQKEASDALQEASEATLSKKETLLATAADLAFKGSWFDDACEQAVSIALAARNDQKNATIKTFASELRLAMHSNVRTALPNIFALGTEAWNEERTAAKANADIPQPLRTAWARRTHMLVALLRDVKDHGSSFPSKQAIIAYGIACDPATDDEKIARKLKTLVKTFDAFHAEFPVESFKAITTYLKKIDAKTLREARATAQVAKAPEPQSNLRKAEPVAPEPAAPEPAAPEPVSSVIAEFNNLTNAA